MKKFLLDILPFGLAGVVAGLAFVILSGAAPLPQDPGQQVDVFSGTTITTTATTATTACGQGSGSIGRKTLSVINETGGGVVTVTAELRVTSAVSNHTSGYLAVSLLAAGSASSDTTTPDEAAGRFCQISAVSDGTSTITVTLRRE